MLTLAIQRESKVRSRKVLSQGIDYRSNKEIVCAILFFLFLLFNNNNQNRN